MIFKKEKKIVIPYTVQVCTSCKKINKRKFVKGDYLFKGYYSPDSKCHLCNDGTLIIEQIFGETIDK